MDGAQELNSKISGLMQEITALKTQTIKTAETIATLEKTVNLTFTIVNTAYGYVSSQWAIITVTAPETMLSQAYIDDMTPEAYSDKFISVRRNTPNEFTVSALRQEAGRLDCTLRIVGTSDFSVNVRYEDR